MTLTHKAAKEMQDRLGQLLRTKPSGLTISTFHSCGVRILREDAKELGYKPRFSIFDANDCFAIVSDLAGSTDKATIRRLQSVISGWKNALISPVPVSYTHLDVYKRQKLYPFVTDKAELDGLPAGFVASLAAAAEAQGKSGQWAIKNTRSSAQPVLQNATNRALREKVWRAFVNRGDNGDANDTNATIAEILKLRQALSLIHI